MKKRSASAWSPNWEDEPDLSLLRRAYDKLSVDPTGAIEDLRTLSDAGSVMSMLYIAGAYRTKIIGTDVRDSIDWYVKAIKSGSVIATYSLAVLYRNIKMFDQSIYYANMGVEFGYPPSMYLLGVIYSNGEGVQKDILAAKELWERASKLGHLFSKRNLAFWLMGGRFGALQVIRGFAMWLSLLWEGLPVVLREPDSWRLEGILEPRRL